MKFRPLALIALAFASLSAQAALTTYAPWQASPPAGSSGLEGVLFNVQSTAGGTSAALGAHRYINGVDMGNDGNSTFYGASGTQAGPTPGSIRANWSFDFGWVLGTDCSGCHVFLGVDTDPSAGVTMGYADLTAAGFPSSYNESWNLMMAFLQTSYAFNPDAPSSTAFRLEVRSGASRTSDLVLASDITVDVPEPGSLALAGLALVGVAAARRRKV